MVEIYVLSVDEGQRKISLSLQPKPKPKKIVLPAVGDQVEGVIEKIMPFGIFVKMKNGVTGLIPNHELGASRGTDHDTVFQVGKNIELIVADVDPVHRKIKLSRKGLMEKKEQEEVVRYKNEMKELEKSTGGFGSFGKLLKAKMEEKNFTL